MPKHTVDFDREENHMIELFKAANDIKTKPQAIKKMVRIAYNSQKKPMEKAINQLS